MKEGGLRAAGEGTVFRIPPEGEGNHYPRGVEGSPWPETCQRTRAT